MAEGPSGTGSPAPIQYIPPFRIDIGDILKFLIGSKAVTTSTARGDVEPLRQVLAGRMDPAMLQLLTESLFQSAAQKIPDITRQFANAIGARVPGNSSLATALALLQQNLAQAIAKNIVDLHQAERQIDVQAAKAIAENTREQRQVQTMQPPSLRKATALSLAPVVAGIILNQIGKRQTQQRKSPKPPVVQEPPVVPTQPGEFVPNYEFVLDQQLSNIEIPDIPEFNLGSALAPGVDFDSSIFPDAVDFAASAASEIPWDDLYFPAFEDIGADWSDDLFDIFSDWSIFDWFADGGKIVRNIPQFGPRPIIRGTSALNVFEPSIASLPIRRIAPEVLRDAGVNNNLGTVATSDAGEAAPPAPPAEGSLTASQAISLAQALVGLVTGNVPAAMVGLGKVIGIVPSLSEVVAALSQDDSDPLTAEDAAVGVAMAALAAQAMAEAISVEGLTGIPETAITPSEPASTPADNAPPADSPPPSDSPPGDAPGESPPGDSPPGDSPPGDSPPGDSGPAGDGDGDGGWYKGGRIPGKSSVALDTVTIKASPGEYVLPVDVVELIGEDVLDDLVNLYHTPARRGTRG